MIKDFMGTLVFLYEASEKAKSLRGALRAVQRICEEKNACITDLVKGQKDGRLGIQVSMESRERFGSDKEAVSWGEKLKSRLLAELPSGGRLELCCVGRITAREKEFLSKVMGAVNDAYKDLMESDEGPRRQG
jgi:hypothetical protein